MSDSENIIGQVILWAARLVGIFLIYLLVRHFKPTLFYKGWNSLSAEYGVVTATLPAGLILHPTSLRIGTTHYNQTAHLGLDNTNVYLQRPLATKENSFLRIPYAQLKLVSPPGPSGLLNVPVYGVFNISGVDVWIDYPYAEQIIKHLPAP